MDMPATSSAPRMREAYDALRSNMAGFRNVGSNALYSAEDKGQVMHGDTVVFGADARTKVQAPVTASDDARTAYFQVERRGDDGSVQFPVMRAPIGGGQAQEVVNLPGPASCLDVSPDQQRFAVVLGSEVSEVQQDGTLRRIAGLDDLRGPRDNKNLDFVDAGRFLSAQYLDDGSIGLCTQAYGPMVGTIETYYVADGTRFVPIPFSQMEPRIYASNLRGWAEKTGFLKGQPQAQLERFGDPIGHGWLRPFSTMSSPKGDQVAFLISLEAGDELWTFPHQPPRVPFENFAPELDKTTGTCLGKVAHSENVSARLEWSADGRTLTAWPDARAAAKLLDGDQPLPAMRWDVTTGQPLPVDKDDVHQRALGLRKGPEPKRDAPTITVEDDFITVCGVKVPRKR